MSAVAVPAARRRWSGRRWLHTVPEMAGPAAKRGPGHSLALGQDARSRSATAVRTLLDSPGLEEASDPVRLAVVVLASRTPSETGVVEIRARELGRWLGLSVSRVRHAVVPGLRRSGVVDVDTLPGEFGEDWGLTCRVLPMWEAQNKVGHPLRLTKPELATLLRLMEALMAPGWAHRDGRVTPAGLLGARTGHGAATDRLALLLLVLEAGETGRVRLCGGRVDKRYGRPVATLARLLGRSLSQAERVLERLEGAGLVERPRRQTVSGLRHVARLVVPAVAAAHGGRQGSADAVDGLVGDLAGTAWPSEDLHPPTKSQVSGARERCGAAEGDLANSASLHTDHSSVVTPVSSPSLSGGFSGEGRGGKGRRPKRVCMREDQAVGGGAAAEPASPVAEVGPLRGEKPGKSAVDEQGGQRAAGTKAGGQLEAVAGGKTRQQGRADLPEDLGLRVALGPVAWLWAGLNRWQQDQVVKAVNAELERLKDLLMQPEGAPRLLADRLTDRLEETGGEARVSSPFGWITRRGLVQRPACSDVRCDDGIRLDTGGDCANCGNVIHIRRARRVRIAADIDRELPGLGVGERRQVLEERLREHAAAEAEDFVWRREQARAEQARREKARAAARQRGERERRAAAAADAVRQTLACEDCGQQRSAGLCEACGFRRRTEAAIAEAGLVAATWTANLDDAADVADVVACVRASVEADIERARQYFWEFMEPDALDADPALTASALAFAELQAVQQALAEYRSSALGRLGSTPEADAEARRAYKTEQNRRWFRANPNGADAVAAATKAAESARERTAEYLLATRLEQLRKRTEARTETVAPASWSARLTELAARPLDGDQAGAAIA
ncbi:hypothetical protein [Streptomyces sp. CdTB01]|uniref:hypothetical protein n=1 Tax=Streptomyces sp. CdTB01 TaxID=1725411 RepID=UPI001939A184|nr:hypothetical protein [Streptomyces sp. CdTB01]